MAVTSMSLDPDVVLYDSLSNGWNEMATKEIAGGRSVGSVEHNSVYAKRGSITLVAEGNKCTVQQTT